MTLSGWVGSLLGRRPAPRKPAESHRAMVAFGRFQLRLLRTWVQALKARVEAGADPVVVRKTVFLFKPVETPRKPRPDGREAEQLFGQDWWAEQEAAVDASFAETTQMAGVDEAARGPGPTTTTKRPKRSHKKRAPQPTANPTESPRRKTTETVTGDGADA